MEKHLIAIASLVFHKKVGINELEKAQKFKLSPDCPQMLRALISAPHFTAVYEKSKAWANAAAKVKEAFVDCHKYMALIRTYHKSIKDVTRFVQRFDARSSTIACPRTHSVSSSRAEKATGNRSQARGKRLEPKWLRIFL